MSLKSAMEKFREGFADLIGVQSVAELRAFAKKRLKGATPLIHQLLGMVVGELVADGADPADIGAYVATLAAVVQRANAAQPS